MTPPVVLISIFRETIIGGIAVHSTNLHERLREHDIPVVKVNYAPVFVGRGVPAKLRELFRVAGQLLRLRLGGARLFHFHASNRALMYYLFALPIALSGGKLLLSLHSGYGFNRWLDENGLFRCLNRVFFRLLDRLIFMNPRESTAIVDRYPFLRDRVVTINPYIAPPATEVPDLNKPERDPGVFKIAAVGVWMRRYNVGEAVAAAVRFHEETGVPTVATLLFSTVIVEDDYRAQLMEEIARARRFITVDILEDHDAILEVLVEQDVLIRASFLDSYGLCVAESLLVGTPTIATDVCRRCAASGLYRQGDMEALQEQLLRVFQGKSQVRDTLLERSEDSFYAYLETYGRIDDRLHLPRN